MNSKNFTTKSIGTRAFIADCNRLLDRCVCAAPKGDAAEIRDAIELVLSLLRHIDECRDDVIFFADEGGSWQVGVEWKKVLPALFLRLSRTTGADDYARRVVEVVSTFDRHESARHFAEAERMATSDQREALMDLRAEDA